MIMRERERVENERGRLRLGEKMRLIEDKTVENGARGEHTVYSPETNEQHRQRTCRGLPSIRLSSPVSCKRNISERQREKHETDR